MSAIPRQQQAPASSIGLDGLISLTERLTDMISTETKLLAERRPAELSATQEEKHRLTAIYAREMAAFKANAAGLKQTQPGLVDTLKQATHRFRQAIEEHTRRLLAMKLVTERVVRAIGEEVAKLNQPIQGYDKKAQMGPAYGSRSAARPATLALNQVI